MRVSPLLPATQICYGFIATWYGTWLAYCPPHDRRTLYISKPFLGSAAHPKLTVRSALAWLQAKALGRIRVQVDTHPNMVDALRDANRHVARSPGGHGHDDTSAVRDAGAEPGSGGTGGEHAPNAPSHRCADQGDQGAENTEKPG